MSDDDHTPTGGGEAEVEAEAKAEAEKADARDEPELDGPDFDVEAVLAAAQDATDGAGDDADAVTDDDSEVTLRDDDLHRPDELDGETVACTLTGTEAEKRAAWMQSELVPHLEAVERHDGVPADGVSSRGDRRTPAGDATAGDSTSDDETTDDDTTGGDPTTDDGRMGGYTLVFAEEALEAVMRFARHEHWCCSFAHFEVHVTPGEDPNELTVYGPEGTDEMFGEEFVAVMTEAAGLEASA